MFVFQQIEALRHLHLDLKTSKKVETIIKLIFFFYHFYFLYFRIILLSTYELFYELLVQLQLLLEMQTKAVPHAFIQLCKKYQ